MGYRNREIEKKFLASNTTLKQAANKVKAAIGPWRRELIGASTDVYWKAPKGIKADFIRVRYMPEGGGMMTIKFTDRRSVIDRVEIDVWVEDPDQAVAFWTHAIGKATGSIHKRYIVYFMDKSEHTTVSIYQVTGDDRVFIEAEALSLRRVDKMADSIRCVLKLKQVQNSLFKIFFKQGEKRGYSKKRYQTFRLSTAREDGSEGKRKVSNG